MDIQALGALAVRENGVSITPTAPKPRQVLALLAVHADQVVPVSALIEELWADRPPRSARTTLQTYVLQLRELITAALPAQTPDEEPVSAKDILVTCPGGYLLNTRGGTSDVREFERLAGLAYRAMDDGDHSGGARLLREALALWSGAPFADVRGGAQLEMEAKRLEESRLCALDQRIEADLRLGRHRELLAELTVLVSRYRTHENLCGQFMIALQRSGRRSEALDVYRKLRGTLVRELGLEPSAALRQLQRSILLSDTEKASRATEPASRLAQGT
ncbi:AfsR/SARP family transcriptional regulator [Streptomyces sp. ISL-96]|uniref:AfsR/SARP family transcriptional regulator n=1 Tax=Streptomyces sp. ISL-96 TaxID=2819191 RepID=UPI001BE6EE5E|nr:AfsR/SARP family transcriptional regulator [Streptomyces sp. ISL-96]MBT2493438.1 AfsR/SARP family transcriptional regulator [Streptomyces sp. ISL-96]